MDSTNRDLVQLRLLSVDEESVRLPKFRQKFPVERQLRHPRRVEGQPVVVPGLTKVAVHEEGLKRGINIFESLLTTCHVNKIETAKSLSEILA